MPPGKEPPDSWKFLDLLFKTRPHREANYTCVIVGIMVFKQCTFFLDKEDTDDDDDVDFTNHGPANQPQPRAAAPVSMQPVQIRSFSLQDLRVATRDFSSSRIIGRGGFGIVYRGVLADGSAVAVKRQHPWDGNWSEAHNIELQFRREIEIGKLAHHPNLLLLLGSCSTVKEKYLVYPFLHNGSLESQLHALDWPAREKIALGLARAVSHLHDRCARMVIHLDVKPANILLGENFEPLLADFGFSELMVKKPPELLQKRESVRPDWNLKAHTAAAATTTKQTWGVSCSYWSSDAAAGSCRSRGVSCWYWTSNSDMTPPPKPERTVINKNGEGDGNTRQRHIDITPPPGPARSMISKDGEGDGEYEAETCVQNIRGTYPYIAPEFFRGGRCSEKADVYGYGVTVLEITRGKRVYDPGSEALETCGFAMERVKRILRDSLVNLNPENENEAAQLNLSRVALLCTQRFPEDRPTMEQVGAMLQMDAYHLIMPYS